MIYHKKSKYSAKEKTSTWYQVGNGYLKIGHKPAGVKFSLSTLLSEGTSTIFTILSEREGALTIRDHCQRTGMDWIWLPLPNGDIPRPSKQDEIIEIFDKVALKFASGERIYMHCSAGMHRTGMVTNALLRYLGFSEAESIEIIFKLRPITAMEVGQKRLMWGHRFNGAMSHRHPELESSFRTSDQYIARTESPLPLQAIDCESQDKELGDFPHIYGEADLDFPA